MNFKIRYYIIKVFLAVICFHMWSAGLKLRIQFH